MTTPSQIKSYCQTQIPDNSSKLIKPANVRNAMNYMVDGIMPEFKADGALIVNSAATGVEWGGLTDMYRRISQGKTIYLCDNDDFMDQAAIDVAPVVQDVIDSQPTGSVVNLYYPYGDFSQSDIQTGGRTVIFHGQGIGGTRILPTTITKGVFRLDYAFSAVRNMTIDDRANTWDLPGYLINRASTKALILVGDGGNTGAIKCLIDGVQLSNSRGQGVRYDGGPILVCNRLGITAASAGGFQGTGSGGDTNHWKMMDVTFTRNFNFGMLMQEANNNGGGAGYFLDTKFYQSENYNLKLEGNANSGSVFLEMSNGWSGNGNATRVIGEPTLQVIRDATSSLTPGMYLQSPTSYGFPLGTYITAVNKDTGVVTLNFNATSSGTQSGYAFYTQRGMRNPSIWLGANAAGNQLHVMGDALDPECFRDDSLGASNQISYNYNGNLYTYDNPSRKMRIFGGERSTGNPNDSFYFTTTATFVNGQPTITLTDTTKLNRIKYGATVTASGAVSGSTTVSSVDQDTGVVTLAANAIADGVYQVIFRPNMRGGYLWRMVDDNKSVIAVTGTNVGQTLFWMARSSLYIGNVKAGSPTITMFYKWDNESQGISVNTPITCMENNVVPDGTTISAIVDNGNGTFTITMSQNALLDRTGITFMAGNTAGVRQVWQNMQRSNSNAVATDAGRYRDEIYKTITGDVKILVPEAEDGLYRVNIDPAEVAAGAYLSLGSFTADTDSKAFVNMAIGDRVDVRSSRNLIGVQLWGEVSAANTITLYMFNPTASAQNFGATNFYIEHTPRI